MNLDLKIYSTFRLGGIAHKVFEIHKPSDVEHILYQVTQIDKPLIILGEGSNSIFANTNDTYILACMRIKGITILHETSTTITFQVGGGEVWDNFVLFTVERNYSGIEALSFIPGTVGASPIQNIGAYGTEVSKVITNVRVFNRESNQFEVLSNAECKFGYRDSIFKTYPNKYIITHVIYTLSKLPPQVPQYKDVLHFFSNTHPSISEIRNAIINIRTAKIPDYKTKYNCGSFFKNPIITIEQMKYLQKKYPNIPCFELQNGMYKIFTGWLIEYVDYISVQTNNFYFYPTNKLILIHTGKGTFEEFEMVIQNITKLVRDSFGITLEMEVNIFK